MWVDAGVLYNPLPHFDPKLVGFGFVAKPMVSVFDVCSQVVLVTLRVVKNLRPCLLRVRYVVLFPEDVLQLCVALWELGSYFCTCFPDQSYYVFLAGNACFFRSTSIGVNRDTQRHETARGNAH